MAYCVFTNCLAVLGSGITPYSSLDSRSGVGMTSTVGQMAFFGSSDNVGPLGMVFQHFCANGICRSDITSTRYGVSGNDLSLNVDSTNPYSTGGMLIKYGGGVAMGTGQPCGALDVWKQGSGASTGGDNLILRGGNSNQQFAANQIRFGYNGGIGYSHAIKTRHNSGANSTNAIDFFLWNTSDAVETVGTKNVMTLDGTGYVGIGTCSPIDKLEVAGGIHTSGTAANSKANTGYLDYYNNQVRLGITGPNITTPAIFRIDQYSSNASVSRTPFYIDASGNTGVGTTSPRYSLDVAGGMIGNFYMSCCNATLDGLGSYDFGAIGTGNIAGALLINDIVGARYAVHAGSYNLTFRKSVRNTVGACVYCTVMQFVGTTDTNCIVNVSITNSLGINTTSPSAKLAVEGSATDVENVARFNNQVNCTTRVWLRNSNHSAYWGLSSTSTADPLATGMCAGAMTLGFGNNFPIQFWNGSGTPSVKMTITSAGDVGIGTGGPSYKLHVNGTFYAAGSSIKYKEGICNYDTDSCLFMCLKPVTYQYKDEWQHLGRELKSQSQIGLIAEDVAQVMPELAILVNEEDEKVVRNVDYEKLSVVLLKEVQKLRQEVDELKNNK